MLESADVGIAARDRARIDATVAESSVSITGDTIAVGCGAPGATHY